MLLSVDLYSSSALSFGVGGKKKHCFHKDSHASWSPSHGFTFFFVSVLPLRVLVKANIFTFTTTFW